MTELPKKQKVVAGLAPAGLHSPDLDSEIRSLIRSHGEDAVYETFKRVTRKKTGPKRVHLEDLQKIAYRDAEDCLLGKSPFDLRNNSKLAKIVADSYKTKNNASTHRTMMRLLRENRKHRMIAAAYHLSWKSHSYTCTIDIANRLGLEKDKNLLLAELLVLIVNTAVDVYCRKVGDPPSTITMDELLRAVTLPPAPRIALPPPLPRTGLLNYKPK